MGAGHWQNIKNATTTLLSPLSPSNLLYTIGQSYRQLGNDIGETVAPVIDGVASGTLPSPGTLSVNQPNMSGRDLYEEYRMGLGPKQRDFKPGDRMMDSMKAEPYIQKLQSDIASQLKAYCQAGGSGPTPNGHVDNRPNKWDPRPIPGDLEGAYQNHDMSYIGSYYGKWTSSNVDCCNRTAVIEYRIYNDMSQSSEMYRIVPNVTSATGSRSTTIQVWKWTETIHF